MKCTAIICLLHEFLCFIQKVQGFFHLLRTTLCPLRAILPVLGKQTGVRAVEMVVSGGVGSIVWKWRAEAWLKSWLS